MVLKVLTDSVGVLRYAYDIFYYFSHNLCGFHNYAWAKCSEFTHIHLKYYYQQYETITVVFCQLSLKTWIKMGEKYPHLTI